MIRHRPALWEEDGALLQASPEGDEMLLRLDAGGPASNTNAPGSESGLAGRWRRRASGRLTLHWVEGSEGGRLRVAA